MPIPVIMFGWNKYDNELRDINNESGYYYTGQGDDKIFNLPFEDLDC